MPSFLYSARIDSKTASVNMRCSFSLAKLMQSCDTGGRRRAGVGVRGAVGPQMLGQAEASAWGDLLKRVVREALKAEDVDRTDEVARVAAKHERRVDALDEVVEQLRVERLPGTIDLGQ